MRGLLILALALFALATPASAQFGGFPGARAHPGVARSHGGAQGMVLLQQQTVPSGGVASLSFLNVISPLYDEYQIEFVNILPGTNGAVFGVQLSSDGGQTWITSGYEYAILDYDTVNFGRYVFSSSTSALVVVDTVSSSAAGAINGTAILANPLSTTTDKTLRAERIMRLSDGNRYGGFSRAWYTGSTAAVNAFRVLTLTGVIASGTVRVYGILNR